MDISQLELIVKKRKERNISKRAIAEKEFEEFSNNVKGIVDEDLLKELKLPEDLSLKGLLPSLYLDIPNLEQYDKEYAELQKLYDRIDLVAKRLMEEAEVVINSYES